MSLYLILGMFYFAVFSLIQEVHPGSFVEVGPTPITASRPSFFYFNLANLTTLAYGDVVPVSRPARIMAVLEAAAGLFCVAIMLARLVPAYQKAYGEGR